MNLDRLKSYEQNTSVSDLLSTYLSCRPEHVINALITDDHILNCWAVANDTDKFRILDMVELSLNNAANFEYIDMLNHGDEGTGISNVAYTLLRLPANIVLPLDWMLD